MSPQSLSAWHTLGVHAAPVPHTFGILLPPSPAPHVCPVGQVPPQLSTPPQPSGIVPQLRLPQVTCVGQPHSCGVPPPPQLMPVVQLPQSMVPPQLSPMTPHDCGPQVTHAAGEVDAGEVERLGQVAAAALGRLVAALVGVAEVARRAGRPSAPQATAPSPRSGVKQPATAVAKNSAMRARNTSCC